MKSTARSLLLGIGLAALSGPVIGADQSAAVVGGNESFALDLYANLRSRENNLFFSPHSISTALAMTYGGARGETAAQMAKTLHFSLPQERLHSAFASLQQQLNDSATAKDFELSVANALWGQSGELFLDPFLSLTRQHYGAGFRETDFRRNAEAARKTINGWVEEQTKKRIENLIPQGAVDSSTRLVLTNAIYFKGKWAKEFSKTSTSNEPFHVAAAETIKAPTMRQKGDFRYGMNNGVQILELPYKGDRLAMVILLPETNDGLPALEKSLSRDRLNAWITQASFAEVDVSLPKFKMTCQFSLAENLIAMGMTNAFSRAADFSGINGKRDLSISAVLHKAFVDVNEEGTEAAAATAVIIRTTSIAVKKQAVFRADHPFLFLIRDTRSGAILFLGRVVKPEV